MPDRSRLPLEIIAYDDRSQTEEVVRGIERLARHDKVDFILPPWGTGFNLAIAPLMDRFGYPQLIGTCFDPHRIDTISKWKRTFWFLGTADDYMGFTKVISTAGKGVTNNKAANHLRCGRVRHRARRGARKKLEGAGVEIVMDKSYPIGTQDFSALLNEASGSGADVFMGLSYPPDTFAISKQARLTGYNPKVFYTGVGTSFPIYSDINKGQVERVMSLGGIDNTRPEMQAYVERIRS